MNPVGDVLCRSSVQDEYVEQAPVRSSDESLLDSSYNSVEVHQACVVRTGVSRYSTVVKERQEA